MLKIAMLSTGEEVLHGDIVDTNAGWLGSEFYQAGFNLTKRSTVGDQLNALADEILVLSFNHDVVIVNGGLGPTSDDVTAQAAAQVSEEELVLFPEWLDVLRSRYQSANKPMPESNVKQAVLPSSATVIDNPIGTACGFSMIINDAVVYFTPGVPSEFKLMTKQKILPDLKARFSDVSASECSRIYTFGLSESGISDILDKCQLPDGFEFGYRSYLPFIEIKLFGPKNAITERVQWMKLLNQHFHQNVVGVDRPMLEHLSSVIQANKQTIAVAEQSTGGWLTSWLQSDTGIESYFLQSWFLSHTLDNSLKEKDALAAAFALAAATKENCNVDIGLVTGALDGEQFTVAISTPSGEWERVMSFSRSYDREEKRMVISTLAADLVRRYLESKPMFASYASMESIKEMHIPFTSV